jgi:Uma2 family endonuclease
MKSEYGWSWLTASLIWEAAPSYRHQDAALRIVNSIHPVENSEQRCGCFKALDVVVRFPDGSQKRPDISIFCEEPPADTEIEMLPAAVVEIISRGYEKKDLEIGVRSTWRRVCGTWWS